ncbi:MAG TPA: HAD family phosphatase [Alphaproteobacteria bacterium]|nr:HAD family phosphatase [Alphaproteobacteria bacterium]
MDLDRRTKNAHVVHRTSFARGIDINFHLGSSNVRRIRAIVFDFGGVLIDWNPRYLYRKLFPGDEPGMERFLAEIGFAEWNRQQDAGRALALAVAELGKQFPAYAHLIRAYHERWEESIAGPLQDTADLLLPLKQAGFELHGLSNWSSETFAAVRPKYSFFQLFDTILLSGDVRVVKPDPRIFQLLLERIGRSAGECLFIDDLEQNISAARALGFETILFESAERLRKALQQRGLLPIP